MNILIIGSGAREHAIATALTRSPQHPQLFCCGTTRNPGIVVLTQQYWVGDITDCKLLPSLAKDWQIDFAIVGPEAPLAAGIVDALQRVNIQAIGPTQKLAQIESSKTFARDLMKRYQLPGLPRYQTFQHLEGIEAFLTELGHDNYVVKADGLMGGKGVKVAGDHLHSLTEALTFCEEVLATGHALLIEEKLVGQEFSFMCFCDGKTLVPMPLVQDHKRAYVDDKGPNTGGMGSYSAADHSLPFLNPADVQEAHAINQQVMHALTQATSEAYIGILYGSFIATAKGVFVIEFNARFGDPESLNVLSILETDFVAICQAMLAQQLAQRPVQFAQQATVCKYAVPEGYPDQPLKNVEIDMSALTNAEHLYLASVYTQNGKIYAAGSRTVACVGVAATLTEAEKKAAMEIALVKGPLFHRPDIGTAELIQRRIDQMQQLRAAACA